MKLFYAGWQQRKKTPNTFIFVIEGKSINLQHRKSITRQGGKGGTACRNHSHIVYKYTNQNRVLCFIYTHRPLS